MRSTRVVNALPLAGVLGLVFSVGVSAQVATLTEPNESAPPEAASAAPVVMADREEAVLAFAQCMRENGVDMDDPDPAQGGFIRIGPGQGDQGIDPLDESFVAAQEACAPILEAARPELDPAAQQERLDQLLSMAQCVRDGGFPDFPDPTMDGDGRILIGGGQGPGSLGIDPASEGFREVMATCSETVGLEGPGPGPGGSGPGPAGG